MSRPQKLKRFNKSNEPHIGEEKLAAIQKAKDERYRSRKEQKEAKISRGTKSEGRNLALPKSTKRRKN